ncbi:FecR family protein [Butyricimonas sp.]|uniref:FecR family protein n=1 Tax=Butyricimonas sp. TaxID=1969738 RepID=UPI0025C372B6|nr:FecR family protein [Butyricimonas sp.]
MERDNIEWLIFRYLQGEMTADERVALDEWLVQGRNRVIFERLVDKRRIMEKMERLDEYDWQKSWRGVEGKLHGRGKWTWGRWTVAASLFGLMVLGVWMLAEIRKEKAPVVVAEKIMPGRPYAELVSSDGEVVALQKDSVSVFLASARDTVMVEEGREAVYNEVRTPRGSEYQVVLPDGSVVWLNSESKLRFPTVFSGGERRVRVSGELYFQVVKDSTAPFKVEVEGMYEVEVLGTEFNVRAYGDIPSATTLVKGSVVIHDGGSDVRLKPGEQACKEDNGKDLSVREVDVTSYVAWKNGYFLFENERLEDILNELARWYNMNVFFENRSVREERFSVEIRRHEDFEEVLHLIERTGTVKIVVKENSVFVK